MASSFLRCNTTSRSRSPSREARLPAPRRQNSKETLRAHGVTILDSGFAPKVSAAELDGINGVFVLLRTSPCWPSRSARC